MAGRSGRSITAALAAALFAALALYLVRGGEEKAPEAASDAAGQRPAEAPMREKTRPLPSPARSPETAENRPAGAAAQAPVSAEGRKPVEGSTAPPSSGKEAVGTAPGTERAERQLARPADRPRFDIVRVDPEGSVVVAGRAAPGVRVEILSGDTVLAETTSTADGSFVALFDLPPGTEPLALVLRAEGLTSPRTIIVTLPAVASAAGGEAAEGGATTVGAVEETVPSPSSPSSPGGSAPSPVGNGKGVPAGARPEEAPSAASGERTPADARKEAVGDGRRLAAGTAAEAPAAPAATAPPSGGAAARAGATGKPAGGAAVMRTAPDAAAGEGATAASRGGAASGKGRPAEAARAKAQAMAEASASSSPTVSAPAAKEEPALPPSSAPIRKMAEGADGAWNKPVAPPPSSAAQGKVSGQAATTGGEALPTSPSLEGTAAAAREAAGSGREAGKTGGAPLTAEMGAAGPRMAETEGQAVPEAPPGGRKTAPAPAPAAADAEAETSVPPRRGSATKETSTTPTVIAVGEQGVEVLQADESRRPTTRIAAITYDPEGEVVVAGIAPERMRVRLKADARPIKELLPEEGGRWRARLPELPPGTYDLSVEAVDESGRVVARDTTPFRKESPARVAEAKAAAAARKNPPLVTVTVQPGNTLWGISRRHYGGGRFYVWIYDANADRIRDPDLIYPGQVFVIPDRRPLLREDVMKRP